MVEQTNLDVGKEVLSYCGRCKLQLAHIIVVMKDHRTPQKVKCKTCQSEHSFKDAPLKKKKASSPKGKVQKEEISWNDRTTQTKTNGKTAQKYSIKQKYMVGDVIQHPQFGTGFVEEIVANDKMNVLFQADVKMLMHNKK